MKCERIGEGTPRHLNTFSNFLFLAVYYTHISKCYVMLLFLTVPMYTILSKI